MPRTRALPLALVALCCAPAIASAGTVDRAAPADPRKVTFTAAPGEQNAVTVEQHALGVGSAWAPRIADATAPLTIGSGCFAVGLAAVCGNADVFEFGYRISMSLGDRDDDARAWNAVLDDAALDGGAGDDELWANGDGSWAYGGDGADVIHTSNNNEGEAYGGPGHDRMYGHHGNDHFFGEDGDDLLVSGGDLVALRGGPGRDHLVGNDAEIDGRLYGDGGPDVLHVKATGFYELHGGDGDDVLTGGTGFNDFDGGDGDDRLHAWDGGQDFLSCGPGFDIAYADPADSVADDCERTRLAPQGALADLADRLADRRDDLPSARARRWLDRSLESLAAGSRDACFDNGRLRVNDTGARCFDNLHAAVRRLTLIRELAPSVSDLVRDLVGIERSIAYARYDAADGGLARAKTLAGAAYSLRKGDKRGGLAASYAYRRAWTRLLGA